MAMPGAYDSPNSSSPSLPSATVPPIEQTEGVVVVQEELPTLPLMSLPPELLIKVLHYLPAKTLLAVRAVSRTLADFIAENPRLQLAILCNKHGLLPTEGAHVAQVPAAMMLERLQQWEDRWERRQGKEHRIEVKGENSIYELQNGIFIRGTHFVSTSHQESFPPIFGRPTDLEIFPLPTPDAPTPKPHTIQPALGPYLDLTLDPSQDLIVLAVRAPLSAQRTSHSYEIHLLNMDGQRRPDVPQKPIHLDCRSTGFVSGLHPGANMPGRMLLQVLGETLAIIVFDTDENEMDSIHCYNWRTGTLLSTSRVLDSFCHPSFALLTPRSYLLTSFSLSALAPVMHLFAIPAPTPLSFGPSPAPVQVFARPPVEIARYHMAPLRVDSLDNAHIAFDLRPDPPSSICDRIYGRRLGAGAEELSEDTQLEDGEIRYFATNPDRGIIEVDLVVGTRAFEVVFLREMLVDRVREWETQDGPAKWALVSLLWEDWGEENCRISEAEADGGGRQWVTYVHGYRSISMRANEAELTGGFPIIRDWNPYRLQALGKSGTDLTLPNGVMRAVREPTTVLAGRTFQEDVTTRLPYRQGVVRTPVGNTCHGVMLDQDHIILTGRLPDLSGWQFDVTAM